MRCDFRQKKTGSKQQITVAGAILKFVLPFHQYM